MWTETVIPERLRADIHDMLRRPRPDNRLRIILRPGQTTRAATQEEENFPAEDGCEFNDWDDSYSTWQQCSVKELNDWEEEGDLESYLAGESNWIHRDVLDSDTLDSYV